MSLNLFVGTGRMSLHWLDTHFMKNILLVGVMMDQFSIGSLGAGWHESDGPSNGPRSLYGNESQHSGPGPQGNLPPNPSGNQMYQPGGGFNRPPQAGQMPMIPGLGPYQTGNPNAAPGGMQSNFNMQSGIPPPLPHGPPPHGGQAHQ